MNCWEPFCSLFGLLFFSIAFLKSLCSLKVIHKRKIVSLPINVALWCCWRLFSKRRNLKPKQRQMSTDRTAFCVSFGITFDFAADAKIWDEVSCQSASLSDWKHCYSFYESVCKWGIIADPTSIVKISATLAWEMPHFDFRTEFLYFAQYIWKLS